MFSAGWRGWFDPTGLVKGWAVERAAARFLRPLLAEPQVQAAGINAGGDMQLLTDPESAWQWRIGIADPDDRTATLATIRLGDGAIATSGIGERGHHIIDPRTGQPATSVHSATVISDRLTDADLWATTAVIAGFDDLSWLNDAHSRSGMLIAPDGRTRRWADSTEVTFTPHDPFTSTRSVGEAAGATHDSQADGGQQAVGGRCEENLRQPERGHAEAAGQAAEGAGDGGGTHEDR
jgi:thiamine biosynthesis lipoprotein